MGSTESKSFTGMPIPGAALIISTLVIFWYQVWHKGPDKNILVLFLTVFIAVLMVSTLRFHGAKELNFSKRKPFWILVAIVVILTIIMIHPPISLFLFAMLYLISGIIENIILFYKRRKNYGKMGTNQ
jgi:CDP-diacylglycerol--serine O-phosphatidyltransferase